MERAIDPDALPVERDSGEKLGSGWRLAIKEIPELTLLKAPVQPIADARQCPSNADEVREALKHDAALTSSEADGGPAHD